MAGETSAELTIVVRAQDAATRVIDGIGKTIGKVLLSPLKFVGNAVAGILKQFFSLKALLVGGGIIGVIRNVTDGLSTSQTKFREVFSAETQRGINAVDDAFGRLGASIRATFGNLVGDGSGGIAGFLDGISNWLRDNQDGIRQFFRDLVASFKEIATLFRALSSQQFSLSDLLFGGGGPVKHGLARQRQFDLALAEFDKQATRVFSGRFGSGREGLNAFTESGDPTVVAAAGTTIDVYERALENATKALTKNGQNLSDNQRKLIEQTAALQGATEALEEMNAVVAPATEIVEAHTEAVKETGTAYQEVVQEAKAAIIAFEEVADTIAGNVTDGLFAFIEGTKTAGQAFASMVRSILSELGRLLIYRSLLNALLSLSGGGGGGGSGIIPTGNVIGSVPAYASGGRSGGGIAMVGENGPEQVILPRGAEVVPSQRSRAMGGGDTINVYGARDPKATAREVAYERRRSAGLRRVLA